MIVASMTITLDVTEDDEVIIFEATEDLAVVTGSGMLTMALDTWLRTEGLRIKGPDSDTNDEGI